jgi:hypothetical protein
VSKVPEDLVPIITSLRTSYRVRKSTPKCTRRKSGFGTRSAKSGPEVIRDSCLSLYRDAVLWLWWTLNDIPYAKTVCRKAKFNKYNPEILMGHNKCPAIIVFSIQRDSSL